MPDVASPAHGDATLRSPLMIIVHHLNDSRSQRVLWLLEELGLAYEVKRYQRDAKTSLAPAALNASPANHADRPSSASQ